MKAGRPKKNRKETPDALSTIGVVPYFPNLRREIPFTSSCLVVTYLEIHHKGSTGLPVTLNVDLVCQDLQMSRRTLANAVFPLATLFRTEAKRWAAARSAREFSSPRYSRFLRTKPYSLVCDAFLPLASILVLRRNPRILTPMLTKAGFSLHPTPQQDSETQLDCAQMAGAGARVGRDMVL
jgi:hypothetical protein